MILQTAIAVIKTRQFQRIVIGAVVGAAVGIAVAKTVEPYLFPEAEVEMIPPYETPEDITLRENMSVHDLSWKHVGTETPFATIDKLYREDNVLVAENNMVVNAVPEEVLENLKWEPAEETKPLPKRLKYAKPVETLSTDERAHADLVLKKVKHGITGGPKVPPVSTFSTREANPLTGGGEQKKKPKSLATDIE